jgi:hypothetical protein
MRAGLLSGLALVGACVAAGCGTSTAVTTRTVVAQRVVVKITAPVRAGEANGSSVLVTGTVDPADATVDVAGQPATVSGGRFTARASVATSGRTTIEAIAHALGRSPGASAVVIVRQSAAAQAGSVSRLGSSGLGQGTGSAPNLTSCGAGVSAGPGTSCGFARNVQAAYMMGAGAGSYEVFSPTTKMKYTMTCRASGVGLVCTGGNGASVYLLR